ncbi:GNAT family N-acetyltransferase [Treponema pedis]|uniref:GNAT family N-acetyltransferase n=1 Tax=Treponema pedis TaxID=409322 RepID=UPI0031340D5B
MNILIKETDESDLNNIKQLWADGDVMQFVGFPDGLVQSDADMKSWYKRIKAEYPRTNHYSIYDDGTYCGEAYYSIDGEHNFLASLDIKLLKHARGKGIGEKGLRFAIEEAFKHGAEKVFVDPNPKNLKAIALYEKLLFKRVQCPPHLLEEVETYKAVYMEKENPYF